MKKESVTSVILSTYSAATIKYVPNVIIMCINTKVNTSYNNRFTIHSATTIMENIPYVINTYNDEEDNISFTSSITFNIDTPKIKEDYVDKYLDPMEKKIKKHNYVDNRNLVNISIQKKFMYDNLK